MIRENLTVKDEYGNSTEGIEKFITQMPLGEYAVGWQDSEKVLVAGRNFAEEDLSRLELAIFHAYTVTHSNDGFITQATFVMPKFVLELLNWYTQDSNGEYLETSVYFQAGKTSLYQHAKYLGFLWEDVEYDTPSMIMGAYQEAQDLVVGNNLDHEQFFELAFKLYEEASEEIAMETCFEMAVATLKDA